MKLFSALLLVAGLALNVWAAALTERANLELAKDADRIYASLAAIHSQEINGAVLEALKADKLAVLADLRGVLAQLPPSAVAQDWPAVSAQLKTLRAERAALEAAGAAAASARAELNADISRLQLQAAYLQLTGKAPLEAHALRRNAALWSLVGAYNSAAAGKADAAWGEGRERAAEIFGDGRNVVVARRWRAVDTEIDEIARDARNGREALAKEKLRELAAFLRRAPASGSENLARHRQAADQLDAASSMDGKAMSSAVLSAKALLPHPRLADEQAVSYAGADKLQRAQLHQLDSIKAEHARVLEREAAIGKYASLLSAPKVAKREQDAARAVFSDAKAWAARGFVSGKQVAAQALEAALSALERGDLKLAARHAGWAADELAQRRHELERTARGVLDRLARLLGR